MHGVSTQRLRVTLADGQEHELQTSNPDLVRWDITAHKHKWPTMREAPMMWATFIAWCAAKRLGLYAGSWEDWSNRDCLEVDFLDKDAAGQPQGAEVDPFPSAPAPDSA